MKLLSTGNPKTLKGQKKGYLTFILHLAPGSLSGYNVCPGASKGCLAGCLNTAGRGRFDKTQDARIRKTRLFFENRAEFMTLLRKDIEAAIREADRKGLTPVIRLNGTSDIRWENIPVMVPNSEYTFPNIFEAFPGIQFYDYTKLSNRRGLPKNYQLTFSRSEENENKLDEALSNGMSIAVVFDTKKGKDLPVLYRNLPVVDGDDTDLRFIDPVGSVVGLRAKGQAKKDNSGFVVNV
jgi:hypothetical protein